ncbi:unnamed protein product [Orchesella dallaii]|uniref:Glutamate receptor n=1 Tax=Orchesella dallaii TaxID=48710 RepID=A0ABP1R409_9HEXA
MHINSVKVLNKHGFHLQVNIGCVSKLLFRNMLAFLFITIFLENDTERSYKSQVCGQILPQPTVFNRIEERRNFSLLYNSRIQNSTPKINLNDERFPWNDDLGFWKQSKNISKNYMLIKSLPQIVPLPTKIALVDKSTSPFEVMKQLYKDFLVDYASKKEWSSVELIIPQNDFSSLCEDFKVSLSLSKATLSITCANEWICNSTMCNDTKRPIVVADFINGDKKVGDLAPISQHMLINYSPRRPIVLLAGNESSISTLLERVQPEALRNYKWTLVKPVFNNSVFHDNSSFAIYDVYGFASSLSPLSQNLGVWTSVGGLELDSSNETSLTNFQQRTLRVTTLGASPVVYVHRASNSVIATGYLPDILESISLLLNFKYVMMTPSDGKFGDIGQDGNWTGMVGNLQRNEADIALMSFGYTKSRQSAMDFSPPVEYSATRLLIRRDWQTGELKWDAFFRPFDWKVWLTFPVLILLGAFTLVVFSKFRLFETTPGHSVWLLSTCFLLQGQREHSNIYVTPYRIAVGTFWLLAVFIFACYTARLTSFLAADTVKMPIKDLNEAVRSHSWKIGLVKGSSFLERVKESRATEMALLWKRLQADNSGLVSGIQDGVAKVYKERFIFFTGELVPSFLVKGNCSYAWLPGKYFPGFGYMGYQKGLPYASAISHTVAKLRETGQMKRIFKKWWGAEATCSGSSDSITPISLLETGSAFLILIIGASISFSFVLIEFLSSAKQENWQTRTWKHHLSPHEFGAPIVHDTMAHLIPVLAQDKTIIWSIEDRNYGTAKTNKVYDSSKIKMYSKTTVDNNRS